MGKISTYELSIEADQDISDIYDYIYSEFGDDQTITYLADLEPVLLKLVDYPELGRARSEIRVGLRSLAYQNHVIFYRILDTHIRVVRVLHGSRDLPSTLSQYEND
jgi:toxin ParE1/3/4